ncbi:MAG: bifunctional acetaldehyde-CoA/alcohol dehydrogenase [Planctomycetes bacterium]|nr:bifunctional acetaldehyde-CoA/alcohol dehydrogenase [Planctomycetota bacterium]
MAAATVTTPATGTDHASARLEHLIEAVAAAQRTYATFTQEQVDRIVTRVAAAICRHRIDLAKAAVAETGMGVVEDKVIKNHFAAEFILNKYRDLKTVGTIHHDPVAGIRRIADPMGVVAAVIPVTNPTSTAAFKILLALKTRNGIVLSPHPRAKACTALAARIAREAAVEAGAPEMIVGWIDEPAVELTQQLMRHPRTAIILATGGPGMVKSAYASGKPALGVGAGNTPAVVDDGADIAMAATSILTSKTFDNGVICASEQAVVAVGAAYDRLLAAFIARGAFLVAGEDRARLAQVVVAPADPRKGACAPALNGAIVGQSARRIAEMAGIAVPATTRLLLVEASEVGHQEPFSMEKLSPVLALYRADDFAGAVDKARALLAHGGLGHTAVLYAENAAQAKINTFAAAMAAGRVLINTPASHGAIGDLYNFHLEPSLTLGCGTWGGNSVTANVGPMHLLNVKTVAERRENMLWYRVPPRLYFKRGCLPVAFTDLAGMKRAFVVTDRTMLDVGPATRVAELLRARGIQVEIFADVRPDPDLATVEAGVARLTRFRPDLVVAVGGGSPMDAAKVMWLMHERPGTDFADLSLRFMDIRKRIHGVEEGAWSSKLVCIPTTAGTGSEVTPFAVITDHQGVKHPLADYALTPWMAIVDADLTDGMPPALTAASGYDAVTHALEALVSVVATPFTDGQATTALRLLFRHLPSAVRNGAKDPLARERVHEGATLAGMAFANAFLGICHSLAHQLGAACHLPHGVANALMIPHVVRFNAAPVPTRVAAFAQYRDHVAAERYADLATALGLGGTTTAEKVEALAQALERLRAEVGLPATITAAGVNRDAFLAQADRLAERAFDDQCTGANPRQPLIAELRQLYLDAL